MTTDELREHKDQIMAAPIDWQRTALHLDYLVEAAVTALDSYATVWEVQGKRIVDQEEQIDRLEESIDNCHSHRRDLRKRADRAEAELDGAFSRAADSENRSNQCAHGLVEALSQIESVQSTLMTWLERWRRENSSYDMNSDPMNVTLIEGALDRLDTDILYSALGSDRDHVFPNQQEDS